MNDDDVRQRLDNITTQWSLVANAHRDGTQAEAVRARQLLVERYQVPIFRYMLSVVKDVELAEDLLQQFAVLVMDGKLQNASPKKGRFRKYVKTVVINLIRQHFRSRKPTVPLSPHLQDGQPVEEDDLFAEHCRHDLLERTFSALGAASPTQSRLLRMRVAIPDATSRELAEKYQQQFKQAMTSANVRKTLQRAHAAFAKILVAEVAGSIPDPIPAEVRAELEELDLMRYCRSAFQAWADKH